MNIDNTKENTYDAIVIGSGISGGWVAKELCEKGIKTLLIERGRMVKHIEDYPTAMLNPWDFDHRNTKTKQMIGANPVISKHYAYNESTEHFYVKDQVHPYIQEKPFDWIRGYQVGGKSLLWARQTQRWSDYEFMAPQRDGFAVDWPIRYADIAPWYSHVEKFVGISGNKDGLDNLPDSEVLPAFEMNVVEQHLKKQISQSYPDRPIIMGRCAHVTQPKTIHSEQGRAKCMARSLCERGCPFGAYFSSNASTLPWAEKTGHLTILPDTVVSSIIYDEQLDKATGVKAIDTHTKKETIYRAGFIFVNGSTLNTNLILLNSKSPKFPDGLGNLNGLLGRYIAFHNYRGRITAKFEGFTDSYYYGRRPTQLFMPSFRNVYGQETDFLRGYMVAFSASRANWNRPVGGIGRELKNELTEAGDWMIAMMMQGETVPIYENHIRLSTTEKDQWGIPLLITSVEYTKNDDKVLQDFLKEGSAMLRKAGCKDIRTTDQQAIGYRNPGLEVHEMGGVRMGNHPETSLLNKWNQLHHCKNVFVTDGACMTSTGNQNPSLTYMALSARAANYAVEEWRKGNI
ncbi:GMC family oxidoreductase [Olivibacter sp. SDN3]|uniref:GMC oxidoreductase n=1 Tax=Olivibacter sp. SDN3 TaxID=2764720 RepID=UPI001651AB9B|nr:GMC family oxidoreductase [Olivibacter sp. SDN3]QNL49291.1 GMC family oxidoreductase [Olivibacter sp. SDN3]